MKKTTQLMALALTLAILVASCSAHKSCTGSSKFIGYGHSTKSVMKHYK